MKIFIKKTSIKFENPHPQPDYDKKNKNNKDRRASSVGFMALIGNFVYGILGGFI
jgi:hypothetical protein